MKSRRLVLSILLLIFSFMAEAQDFGGYKVGLGNFIRRMYSVQPFTGVKVLESEAGGNYMVSVVELKNDPSKSENIQNQIASVKAKSYVSQYLNGSQVSAEVIVMTSEEQRADSTVTRTQLVETIRENSSGFTNGMELLIKFLSDAGDKMVYIYFREVKKK